MYFSPIVPIYGSNHLCLKGLVRSGHLFILVMPRIVVKPVRKTVSFRDVREHRKLCMAKKMDQFDWERFTICDDPSENVRRLSETLLLMFNELNAFQL